MVQQAEVSGPVAQLIDELGESAVVTDPALIDNYRWDWTRSEAAGKPLAVARPTDESQVQAAVRWAARHNVPIIPRGAGSGLSGGSCAVEDCLMLSLDRMRDLEIDVATRTAVAQPGVFNAELKAAAAEHGLWYPPDPSSFEICSIGGNAATNAGGLCCVKYGVTTDYVLGLDVVLADGTLVRLGGKRIKDVAGLSLTKLFVGSEGTLGIITRVIVKLIPAKPPAATLVGYFPTVSAAAQAVVQVGATLRPSMMELMDSPSINSIEDFRPLGLDRTAGAMLIAQSDAPGDARQVEIDAMEDCFRAAGSKETFVTTDPAEGELFLEARRAAFPAAENLGALMLEDVGVPIPQLPALVEGIEQIAQRHRVRIPTVAHAGDGNTHPIVVYDPTDADAKRRAALAFDDVMQLAISLGGTISGEHGIGRLKRGLLADQLGPDVLALTNKIKDALDPQRILNPGAGY